MRALKAIEQVLKRAAALLLALCYWRPWRRDVVEAALGRARRILVVRIDDRVGEAILLTPLLATLKGLESSPRVEVLVHPRVARVLEGNPVIDEVISFRRKLLWWTPLDEQVMSLRERRYDVVVDAGNWSVPSVSHAVLSRVVGPRSAVVGPAVWPTGLLLTHPIRPRPDTREEIAQRLHLLSVFGDVGAVEEMILPPAEPTADLVPLLDSIRDAPHAVVNPGGRLDWRRLPGDAFATVCKVLLEEGIRPVVTWGPGEEGLARFVVDSAPGAMLAPPTSISDLACLMRSVGFTVCNNTGPMHLSVAVGTPTLQLFVHMDSVRWGHPAPPHRVADLTAVADRPEALDTRLREEIRQFLKALTDDPPSRGVA